MSIHEPQPLACPNYFTSKLWPALHMIAEKMSITKDNLAIISLGKAGQRYLTTANEEKICVTEYTELLAHAFIIILSASHQEGKFSEADKEFLLEIANQFLYLVAECLMEQTNRYRKQLCEEAKKEFPNIIEKFDTKMIAWILKTSRELQKDQ